MSAPIKLVALVGLYAAVGVAALAVVNAEQGNALVAYGMVVAVSLLVGWMSGSGWMALVAIVLLPLAVPFGETNQFTAGDDTTSVVVLAQIAAVFSALALLLGAGARRLWQRRQGKRRGYGRKGSVPSAGGDGGDFGAQP